MSKRRKREWFDDDSFWKDLYPFMFPDERFVAAAEQVEKALALARPPGRAVLDLCCGPGRCAIPLAQAGYEVTGVDRTSFLLDEARSRARAVGAEIEWIRMDMRDFVREEAFDLVLSMFTSFGYFDDKDEDLLVLRNICRSLRPGGACLIEMVGKEHLARIFQATSSDVLAGGARLVQRREIFDDWTRIRNEWILIRKGHAKTFTFHHTLYSGQELRDRMMEAGFSEVRLYGNLEGDSYGLDALRLVAVAYKGRKAAGSRGQTWGGPRPVG